MADLKDTETHRNLLDSFARETQNNHRYRYFAKMADIEGEARRPAPSATSQRAMLGTPMDTWTSFGSLAIPSRTPDWETKELLLAAMQGENEAAETAYLQMAETARREVSPHRELVREPRTAKGSHAARCEEVDKGLKSDCVRARSEPSIYELVTQLKERT